MHMHYIVLSDCSITVHLNQSCIASPRIFPHHAVVVVWHILIHLHQHTMSIYTSIHAHTYLNYSSCWEVYSIDYITGGIDGLCIQLVES